MWTSEIFIKIDKILPSEKLIVVAYWHKKDKWMSGCVRTKNT